MCVFYLILLPCLCHLTGASFHPTARLQVIMQMKGRRLFLKWQTLQCPTSASARFLGKIERVSANFSCSTPSLSFFWSRWRAFQKRRIWGTEIDLALTPTKLVQWEQVTNAKLPSNINFCLTNPALVVFLVTQLSVSTKLSISKFSPIWLKTWRYTVQVIFSDKLSFKALQINTVQCTWAWQVNPTWTLRVK